MVKWTDNIWWTLTIVVLVVCYALYRVLLVEPASASPVPYAMRVCAIVIYLPLMYVTGMSVIRLYETKLGKQMQFSWGEFVYEEEGEHRTFPNRLLLLRFCPANAE